MKKLLLVALLTLAVTTLSNGSASAGFLFHKNCGCCCATICIKQYNAFTPVCCGNLCCDGCCPMTMGCCGGPCCAPPCGGESCPAEGCCADGSCLGQLPTAAPCGDVLASPTEGAPHPGVQGPVSAPIPQVPTAMHNQPQMSPAQAAYYAAYRYQNGYAQPAAMPVSYNYPSYGYNLYPNYGYGYGANVPAYWNGGR
jgi:hypothetical protein